MISYHTTIYKYDIILILLFIICNIPSQKCEMSNVFKLNTNYHVRGVMLDKETWIDLRGASGRGLDRHTVLHPTAGAELAIFSSFPAKW